VNTASRLFLVLVFMASAARAEEPVPADPPAAEAAAPPGKPAVHADAASRGTMDHLELDATAITGNRELPKVMVIVPWKKADLGDLSGKPANSLLNEVLQPVDREVFRRELSYFDALDAKPET
jgi:hypothetical protein